MFSKAITTESTAQLWLLMIAHAMQNKPQNAIDLFIPKPQLIGFVIN